MRTKFRVFLLMITFLVMLVFGLTFLNMLPKRVFRVTGVNGSNCYHR